MYEKNWSISFENDNYENNINLLLEEAINAAAKTAEGYYVNMVTPAKFGHPDKFLTEALDAHLGTRINTKFIDQCGCGGYVIRVWKLNN